MTLRWLGKKLFKITGITFGILLVLLTAFHLWFVSRAKTLLEETVEKRSDGKLKLQIDKLRYNYFNHRMVIRNAVFITTDSSTASSSYRFAVREIKLDLKALLPLVLHDQLLIDSLRLKAPDITVTTLRLARGILGRKSKDVSIPYEMGKVYNSIRDALNVLRVTRFQIDDGTFTLINKVQPGQVPLRIGNIQIQIDNLQVDSSELTGREKLLFSDNVALHSTRQDILFPDGRHRLAFSGFRINLKNQLVEFDSCTIAATRTDSSISSFHVFFDTLKLTRIDFDTLYRSEVIKADSVYCLNPKFELVAETGKKRGGKRPLPKLETIVQQLTGNLLLGFVGVENADFNIRVTKDGDPTSYTFTRNSFEMQGLSIDQDAAKPIKVESFAMAIRNYENFIKDSSYSIRFDSIRFRDDRIILSDFLFHKLDRGKILNSFRVPQFRLEGLSWDDLVFEKKLKAKSAVMVRPDIDYTPSPNPRKRQNLFQSLGAVNEYMDLDRLEIENGKIDLKLKKDLRIQLEDASLSVRSQSLLSSTRLAGIKNSLNDLRFDKGFIQAGTTTIALHKIRYDGESGKFAAGDIRVTDTKKNMNALLKDMTVDKMVVDERTGDVFAEGINWQEGHIQVDGTGVSQNKSSPLPVIELKNLEGNNTIFNGTWNGTSISTNFRNIRMDLLEQRPGTRLLINGLSAEGHPFTLHAAGQELSVEEFSITDKKRSVFRNAGYLSDRNGIKTTVSVPTVSFVPHILRLLNGELALDAVQFVEPVLHLGINKKGIASQATGNGFPETDISELTITRPEIHLTHQNDSGSFRLDWYSNRMYPGDMVIKELKIKGGDSASLSIRSLKTQINDFLFTNRKGRSFNSGDGKAVAEIKDIQLNRGGTSGTVPTEWKAHIIKLELQNYRFDSLGKNRGLLVLSSSKLSNFDVRSATIGSLQKLVTSNSFFRIENTTGHYNDLNSRFTWRNGGYDRNADIFSLDTFSYRPSLDKDSFLLTRKYQADYMEAGCGPARIGPVDLSALLNDHSFLAKKVSLENAFFTDYKDKSLPFNPGIIKPLPVAILKKIPVKIAVDTIHFNNGNVLYTELNEKTKRAGTIPVKRMSLLLLDLKNFNLSETDSLEIHATGYILDTLWTRLRVKQSYFDSAGGFLMTVRMKPVDLAVLNSALIPLASVKLLSGKLDTLDMRAVGREYLAIGEMRMLYKDLKIQILKDGMENKKTLRTRLLSALANSFMIRASNKTRTGDVFFIRHRDRSAINYLIRILFSGVASSTGVKSHKKEIRKHRKELKEKNLPLFDTD